MAQPSDRLRNRILADFGETDARLVVEELLDIPESLPVGGQQSAERLQASVVVAAQGDLATFLQRMELIRLDWRDALMYTGLEQADWPRRLDELLGS